MKRPPFLLALPVLPSLLAVSALLGWVWDIPSLKQGLASSVSMNPATAICLALLGLEAIRINALNSYAALSKAGQLAIIVVVVISLIKLSDLLFGTSFAIDQHLFSSKLSAESSYSSRMAPNTVASLLLLSLAMQLQRSSADTSVLKAQLLGAVVLLIGLLALIGNLFNTKELSAIAHYIPMAVNTALCVCFLSMCILSTNLQKGLMRFVRWDSLKTRVTLFTLLFFVISIWSLSYYASRMLHENMQRQLGEQQFSSVSMVAAELTHDVDDRLRAMQTIAAMITPASMRNVAALQRLLEDRVVFQQMFNGGTFVIGIDGTAIAEFPLSAQRIGVNYLERDFISAVFQEGKPTISRPVMGKKLMAPIIGITVPIRDSQGKVIAGLAGVTNLGLPNFLHKITEGRYGKSGGFVLFSTQDRLIITASDKSRIMEVLPPPGKAPWIDRLASGYEGSSVAVNPRGVEVLVSAKGIPAAGWFVQAILPTEEAFAPIYEMQQRVLLATIFLTLLFGCLTWWMLRRQLSPMLTTVKTLVSLSNANQAPQPLPIRRQDEVGELIGGFNRLLETLKKREEELHVHQTELSSQNEELQRAQRELEAAHARYFDLYDMAPVGYCSVSEKGQVLQANLTVCTMLGVSRELLMKRPISRWILRQDQHIFHRCSKQIIESGELQEFELRIMKGDGTSFWAHLTASATQDVEGAAGLRIALSDITERTLAKEMLRQSNDKYRRIFEDAAIGVFHSIDDRFIDVNPALARMLGYDSPQEVISSIHSISEQIYADPPKRAEIVTGALAKGEVIIAENRYRRKNGAIWIGNLILRSVSVAHGQPQHFEGFVEDITERKAGEAARTALEAQLRESQKMDALGTLAGGVAHDFNNALAVIIGNTELVLQDVGPEHAALESLEEIGKASRRAKALVQQILAFGRRQTTERKVISLAPIVQEAAKFLRSTIPAGVSLNVACAPDAPTVLADATQIEQVLINLGGNAWHAIEGQERAGLIEIRLEAEVRNSLHFAVLTVSDNGQGMDEATRARIFEPFFTTKAVDKGTGLGLSVVYGIAQAHEAGIEVRSTPGEGTAFIIRFVAAEQSAERAPARNEHIGDTDVGAPLALQSEGKRVLYVDDEESIVSLMTRLLGRRGYRVTGYTDPRKALEAVRANPDQFDLAVTDYNMPGMSGLEVAQALREIRPDLPVILISGYITEELQRDAPAAGVRELIFKADAVEDVCEAVARYANAQSRDESIS